MTSAATDPDEDFAPPPPRSRVRWVRKVALWLLAVAGVVLLVLLLGRWQVGRLGQRQLESATAKLDADEPGWRLDAIQDARKRAEPPPAENAAPVVLDVAGRIPENFRKWQSSEEAAPFWVRHRGNRVPPADVIETARKASADTLLVRADAIRLRDRRGGQFPLNIGPDPVAVLLPHLNECRSVAALLQFDAHLAAIDKNPDRGVSAARAALAVARAIGDEPFLISQLVRIACAVVAAQTALQVLAWGEPTEGLAELQAELLAEADAGHFRIGMRGERAMLDKTFRGLEDGTIPAETWFNYAGINRPGPEHHAAFRAYRALIPGDHAKALEILTAYCAAANLPHHEQVAAVAAVPVPKGPPDEFRYVVTRMMVPACQKIAEAGLRCRAELLSAATGIACERFRRKHARWPREVAELVPEFLPAVPLNPFDGKPITYKLFPDRVAVYCWWPNPPYKMDDLPEDLREGNAPGVGIGCRVWLPDRRGLQPEDKKNP